LLAEEEATPPPKKATPKASSKKAASAKSKPAGPGAIAAGGAPEIAPAESTQSSSKNDGEIESFAATGIDNALDLIDVVTAKMDKASVGNQAAATVEKHPEVRSFVPEFWLLHLTFQHSPSAETIQGAPFFFCLFLRLMFRLKGRIQRLRGSRTPQYPSRSTWPITAFC
jgi:hypothetical protein